MGLFARRLAENKVETTSGSRPAPEATVPARFRVGAVTAPADGPADDTVLVSGVVTGTFPPQIVQLTVHLPPSSRPVPGQELPAVVDPAVPGRFAVTWAVVAVIAGVSRTINATEWHQPVGAWDPGRDGAGDRELATWLVAAGYRDADFPPGLGPPTARLHDELRALGWPDGS